MISSIGLRAKAAPEPSRNKNDFQSGSDITMPPPPVTKANLAARDRNSRLEIMIPLKDFSLQVSVFLLHHYKGNIGCKSMRRNGMVHQRPGLVKADLLFFIDVGLAYIHETPGNTGFLVIDPHFISGDPGGIWQIKVGLGKGEYDQRILPGGI